MRYDLPTTKELGKMHKQMLGLRVKTKIVNVFAEERRFPLGTKRPYGSYDGQFEESDFVWYNINPRKAVSILIIANRGAGKTVIEKRMADYFFSTGYRLIVFDPKEREWSRAANMGSGKKLHPKEQAIKLPVLSYVPYYLLKIKKMNMEEVQFNGYTLFSESIYDFQEQSEWLNFGMSPIAADEAVRLARRGYDFKKIFSSVRGSDIMHHGVKGSVESRLSSLIEAGFFTAEHPPIPIKGIWGAKRKMIPVINFYQSQTTYVNAAVGKMLNRIRDISNDEKKQWYKHQKEETEVTVPTLIIADDAAVFIGAYLDKGTNVSIEVFRNALSLWRSLGISVICAVQSPSLIDRDIFDMFQTIFVANNIADRNFLLRFGAPKEVVEEVSNLEFNTEHGHTVEWLMLKEDKKSTETFYPLLQRCA